MFADGRALLYGARDEGDARAVYDGIMARE